MTLKEPSPKSNLALSTTYRTALQPWAWLAACHSTRKPITVMLFQLKFVGHGFIAVYCIRFVAYLRSLPRFGREGLVVVAVCGFGDL